MQKGPLLEAVLEQQEAVHKDGWNVATSQRCDVVQVQLGQKGQLLEAVLEQQEAVTSTRVSPLNH